MILHIYIYICFINITSSVFEYDMRLMDELVCIATCFFIYCIFCCLKNTYLLFYYYTFIPIILLSFEYFGLHIIYKYKHTASQINDIIRVINVIIIKIKNYCYLLFYKNNNHTVPTSCGNIIHYNKVKFLFYV